MAKYWRLLNLHWNGARSNFIITEQLQGLQKKTKKGRNSGNQKVSLPFKKESLKKLYLHRRKDKEGKKKGQNS